MTNSVTLTEISPGDTADADIIMYNFNQLTNAVDANTQSLTGVTSNKNSANGYCGLDSEANLPSTVLSKVLGTIYPVGSIYITTSNSNTCPLASLITNSTWTKVGAGKFLQQAGSWKKLTTDSSATNHAPGTSITQGLPNITGNFRDLISHDTTSMGHADGVFNEHALNDNAIHQMSGGASGSNKDGISFNATRSSTIYGQTSNVQPNAYCVNIWERTA